MRKCWATCMRCKTLVFHMHNASNDRLCTEVGHCNIGQKLQWYLTQTTTASDSLSPYLFLVFKASVKVKKYSSKLMNQLSCFFMEKFKHSAKNYITVALVHSNCKTLKIQCWHTTGTIIFTYIAIDNDLRRRWM